LPDSPDRDMDNAFLNQLASRAEEAIKLYRRVTEAQPDRLPAFEALAALLYRRSDLQGALAAYTRLTELKPGHLEALTRLGSLNLKLGRREQAQAAWELALKADPGNAIVRKNLSVLKG